MIPLKAYNHSAEGTDRNWILGIILVLELKFLSQNMGMFVLHDTDGKRPATTPAVFPHRHE